MKKNQKSGFTLIELLVVIAIISILATLLMTNFIGIRQRGRDGVRKSDLRTIQSALEFYRSDNGSYPATASFACGGQISSGTTVYMREIPCDPLDSNTEYQYVFDSANNTYELTACLENTNDPEKDGDDGSVNDACGTGVNGFVSFTVSTP